MHQTCQRMQAAVTACMTFTDMRSSRPRGPMLAPLKVESTSTQWMTEYINQWFQKYATTFWPRLCCYIVDDRIHQWCQKNGTILWLETVLSLSGWQGTSMPTKVWNHLLSQTVHAHNGWQNTSRNPNVHRDGSSFLRRVGLNVTQAHFSRVIRKHYANGKLWKLNSLAKWAILSQTFRKITDYRNR